MERLQITTITISTILWTVKYPSTWATVHRFHRPNNCSMGYRFYLKSDLSFLCVAHFTSFALQLSNMGGICSETSGNDAVNTDPKRPTRGGPPSTSPRMYHKYALILHRSHIRWYSNQTHNRIQIPPEDLPKIPHKNLSISMI